MSAAASLLLVFGACAGSKTTTDVGLGEDGGLSADTGSTSQWCKTITSYPATIDPSPDKCTNGEGQPSGPATAAVSDTCVTCTPRCGAQKVGFAGGGAYYLIKDLPSGACPTGGEICDMAAMYAQECNGQMQGCAVNGYRCTCSAGQWDCKTTGQGGGACPPCQADGGATADAGPPGDASTD